MSGFASRLQMSSILNRSAYAGPRRLVVIAGVIVLFVGTIAVVSLSGSSIPPKSLTARMPQVNSLPGGLNGNAQQSKLSLLTDQQQADAAAKGGSSFTPPIPASVPGHPIDNMPPVVTPSPAAPVLVPVAATAPVSAQTPQAVRPQVHYAADPMVRRVSQDVPVDPNDQTRDDKYVDKLLRGWDGRSPVTNVVLPPVDNTTNGNDGDANSTATRDASYSSRYGASGSARASKGEVLIPAGRGIYAHTVLAASTDSDGPVVLQADSGPLAGDRMIGTFGKASANGGSAADRMVVRVSSVEHHGHIISVDGLVTAPDTMETTVASSVDEHYMSRFLLPAAAAFVQGLGTALASTSDTTQVASGLGGVSSFVHLSLPQQLGVGAGVAAAQVGNTLNQEAPKGPTVHLDANANVGVMFLTAVVDTDAQ